MPKAEAISAGLVMCRHTSAGWQYLLAHPGGPFFARKDDGVWTIPKGGANPDEDLLSAAKREFTEETGFSCEVAQYFELGSIVQRAGKRVYAWAFEGDCDPAALVSNTCVIPWPPRSGKMLTVPEVDRASFFTLEQARSKAMPAQLPLLERAEQLLRAR